MKPVFFLFLISITLGVAGCQADVRKPTAEGSEIAIAVAGPMTGDLAEFGLQLKRGADKAVADINAAGGVLGKQLILHIGDDQCDPKRAPRVANTLVDRGVVFVDGHFCSGSSIPASVVYQDAGVLQITPASTNPRLTDNANQNGWTTLFRTCGRDDAQGEFAGAWLAKHFSNKRVALVHDGSGYGELMARLTKKAMNAGGLQEVLFESIRPGKSDYGDLVLKLGNANVDAVYFGGYHVEASVIVRQLRAGGVQATLFAGDALNTFDFARLAGAAADGVMFTNQAEMRNKPSAREIVAAFRSVGIEPEGYTLSSYAAVQVWAQAVSKAGTTDAVQVAAALRSQSWETVIGPLSFDSKGDVTRPDYVWYEFSQGRYRELGI